MNQTLAHWLARLAKDTKKAYTSDIKDFAAFMGGDMDDCIDDFLASNHGEAYAIAHDYAAYLEERGVAPRTLNRRLAALRSLSKHAQDIGLINWSLKVKGRKVRSLKDTEGPGLDGCRDILAAAELSNKPTKTRDLALVWLILGMALRRKEIAGLDLSDIEGDKITVLRKARDESTTLAMPSVVSKAVRAWVQERGIWQGPLFTSFNRKGSTMKRLGDHSINNLVKELGDTAGVDCTTNSLRHTSNTLATIFTQQSGLPLEEVLSHTGHSDVRTAMIYRDNIAQNQLKIAEGVTAQLILG